jgi:subtilisin-like proprotein convertase family protein
LVLLLTTAVLATAAHAAGHPANQVAQIHGKAPEGVVNSEKASVGRETGVPRSLANESYQLIPSDPETMARQYLRENSAKLQLPTAQLGNLFVRATRKGLAGTSVRFEQRVDGIPVRGPDVVVNIDASNKVTFVMNGYQPGVVLTNNRAGITPQAATADVMTRLGVTDPPAWQSVRLVVVPDGKDSRLAYEVRVIPSTPPHGEWLGLVDAVSSEIFQLEDIALDLNGSGFVFDPDPLSSAHATYGSPGFTDAGDVTTAQLDAQRASRTLLDITDTGGGIYKLQGPYAEIVDTESPFKGLFTQASTTFNYNRFDDNFEAVNCYYHIDTIMRYINTTLGIPLTPFQYVGGARFDPSGFSGADNSHYTSGNGVVAFGEGGVDDAEDADVITHELGHGIHDWLTSGNLSQVDGLSEGTGDYVCQSYSRSFGQWAPADPQYQWTFNWDGHNEFWPGRVTNYPNLSPGGLDGEVHDDGQIWATCLMRIWNDIGRFKTDKAVFEGLAMTNSGTNQNQAAQAVLQAAISMGYTGSEISSMVTEMRATGYTVSVGVDYVSNAITDECSAIPGNVNGVLEPGENAEIRVTVVASSLPRTGVAGVLTSATPGVTILDGNATWPNLTPGVPTVTDAPHFRVHIDPQVACLSTVNFQLSITTNEGGPFVSNFSIPIGSSLTPSGLPLAVPDATPAGAASTLSVPTGQILTDVNVRVQMTHTWVGDISIKLKSPLGTVVTLLDRPGVPASTFGCSNDNMDVTFDDAGVVNLETWCAGTTPWYTGVGLPTTPLSAFNGQSTLGNWVLTVVDNAGGDVGVVTNWQLITNPPIAGICNVCDGIVATMLAFFVAKDNADGIAVSWEFSDRTDVASIALDRATAQVGPWEEVTADYAKDGTRTEALDRSVQSGETYYYRLRVNERDGTQRTMGLTTALHGASGIRATALIGASPNPMSKSTSIAFQLSKPQMVNLSVVDAQGRRIRTLFDGQLQAGSHSRIWDGSDESGKSAPAGLYFGVMYTPEGRQSSRFILLR